MTDSLVCLRKLMAEIEAERVNHELAAERSKGAAERCKGQVEMIARILAREPARWE